MKKTIKKAHVREGWDEMFKADPPTEQDIKEAEELDILDLDSWEEDF